MQKKNGEKKSWKENISDNVLDLSLLQLTEFPAKNKIILPKIVTCLNLSNNKLTAIPPHLCTLTQLREIDLSKNKLLSLPDQFGDLINLRKLDLYDNELSFLPLSFHKLQKLKWLDISLNPVPEALLRIAGPCTNSAECERAAHNVVIYFGVLKNQVSEHFFVSKAKKIEKEKAELDAQFKAELEAQSKSDAKSKKRNKGMKKVEEGTNAQMKASAETTSSQTVASLQPKRKSLWKYFFVCVTISIFIGFLYLRASLPELLQCLRRGTDCSHLFHY